MKKNTLIFIALILIVLIAGCGKSENGFLVSGKKIVKVNNDYITDDMVEMFASGGYLTDEQKQIITDELIKNFLIYNEAIKSDIMKDTVFVNQLELQRRLSIAGKFIEDKLKSIPLPTEDEIQAYYQSNKSKFDKQTKIALIVFAPTETKEVVDSVYNLLKTKKKSFKKLAKEFSVDQATAQKGGVIDRYFAYQEWTFQGFPSIDLMAFSLKNKGDISEPFMTKNGSYAIIKLIDKIPSNKKYEDLRQMIMTIIMQEKRDSFLSSYTEKLMQEANIEKYSD